MIYPKFINKNNVIGVPTPSDGSSKETDVNRIKNAKRKIEELGFKVQLSENIFNSEKGRSASAKERAEELNKMFENHNIDMIWCNEGGEFLTEIIPYIDFEKLVQNPKYIEGFSDPTGILFSATTKYDIATIYGNNFKSFGMEEYHESLNNNLEIVKGNLITQNSFDYFENEWQERVTGLEGYKLTDKVEWKILSGESSTTIKGRVLAGCIDIIDVLAGTKYDGTLEFCKKYKSDGIVWCFDNCDLSKEQLIRTLWKLHELGYFKYTNGIIFGRCGNDNSRYEYDMKNCLKDSVVSKLNIPIVYDADISHKSPSLTIINGAIAEFNVQNGRGIVKFELK